MKIKTPQNPLWEVGEVHHLSTRGRYWNVTCITCRSKKVLLAHEINKDLRPCKCRSMLRRANAWNPWFTYRNERATLHEWMQRYPHINKHSVRTRFQRAKELGYADEQILFGVNGFNTTTQAKYEGKSQSIDWITRVAEAAANKAYKAVVYEFSLELPKLLPANIDHLVELHARGVTIAEPRRTVEVIGAEFLVYGTPLQDYIESGMDAKSLRDLMCSLVYETMTDKVEALTDGHGVLLVAGVDDSFSLTDREARQLLSLA